MIANFFKYLIIGIVALIALKIALAITVGLIGLALVAIPFAVVGFVVYKIAGGGKKKEPQISDADRRWLES